MLRSKYILTFLILRVFIMNSQQQGLFTNFLLHQYLYNPAFIGVTNGSQFNIGYRDQWVGFDGAPTTAVFSGYGNLRKKPKISLGANIISEQIGLINQTSFMGMYGYHLQLNKKAAIEFGLGIGGVQYSVKAYSAKLYDQDDNFLNSGSMNAFAFDANAGLYFHSGNFFFGISDQHLPNGKIYWNNSIGRLKSCVYAYTGYNIEVDKKKEWIIQPSVLIRKSAPAPYQMELNVRTTYRDLVWVGFNYRHQATSSAMVGCVIDKQYKLAYAYDFTLGALAKYSSGTHEIILSYYLPQTRKRSKSDKMGDADEDELNTIDNSIKTSIRNKKETEEKGEEKSNKDPEQK